MRAMKKKLQREGVFKEMKQRRAYEKPSEKKARLLNESTRRCKKLLRKNLKSKVTKLFLNFSLFLI